MRELSAVRRLDLRQDLPILAIVGFNVFTLLVFMTAPVDWQTDKRFKLCAFVLICQLFMFFGFRLGRRAVRIWPPGRKPPLFHGKRLMTFLLVFYALTFTISYAYRMEFSALDISGMFTRLLAGVRDAHSGYEAAITKTNSGSISWTTYFAISVFNQLFFTAGFLYWSRWGRAAKALFLVFVAIDLFYWVGVASSFGVVKLSTTLALAMMFRTPRAAGRWRGAARGAVLLTVLLGGTIAFFSYNLYRRSNVADLNLTHYQVARAPILRGHPSLGVVPRSLWPTYVMVVSYFGQGYYHTCFAFDLEFRPTGFTANNPALLELARLAGIDSWQDTYMHRLHRQGIDEYGVWHSAYTWFASDVSFWGVPPLLLVISFLFGFSWTHGWRGDFLSRVVFVMLGNILVFLFANNTYLASVFYAFIVFVPVWLLTRFLGVVVRAPE